MSRSFVNPLSPGDKLQEGKYIIIEVFGQGLFSITYLGTQKTLNKRVIIHEYFLRDHFTRLGNRSVVNNKPGKAIFEKFGVQWIEEAKILAKCGQNEHVVAVLDTFRENDTQYFVTDYINEEDLSSFVRVESNRGLKVEKAVDLITQIADGLSFIHRNKFLHLDLTPGKILIGNDHKAVIVDLGLNWKEIPSEILPDPLLLVKPGYTPPEFLTSGGVPGVYSDVYALGAILFFMLTGKDPVSSREQNDIEWGTAGKSNPSVSQGTERVIRKAMMRDPSERFGDVGEFMDALHSTVRKQHIVGTRKIIIPAVTALCCLLLLAGFFFFRGRSVIQPGNNANMDSGEMVLNGKKAMSGIEVTENLSKGISLISSSSSNETVKMGKFYALIIAVQNYRKFDRLNETVYDATSIFTVLSNDYIFNRENIIFLKDPIRDSIYAALQFYRENLTPDDNLLIFFSGHGLFDKDEDAGYIIPVDADRNNSSRWISFRDLRLKFKVIPARHILLIADACYAGSALKGDEGFTTNAKESGMTIELFRLKSRNAFTSAYLKPVPDKSYFAKYLITCLKNNREKLLLSEDLYFQMKNVIRHSTSSQEPPKYGTLLDCDDEKGDFVFIHR
jgi:serine/threonine protein kinase